MYIYIYAQPPPRTDQFQHIHWYLQWDMPFHDHSLHYYHAHKNTKLILDILYIYMYMYICIHMKHLNTYMYIYICSAPPPGPTFYEYIWPVQPLFRGRIIPDKSLIRKGWALLRKTLIDPEESHKSGWEGKRRIKSYESCFTKGGEWDQRRKSLIQKRNLVKKEVELIQWKRTWLRRKTCIARKSSCDLMCFFKIAWWPSNKSKSRCHTDSWSVLFGRTAPMTIWCCCRYCT